MAGPTDKWDIPQTVTVTPFNDALVEASPHTGRVTHTAAGGGYDAVAIADYTIAIADNDANLHFVPAAPSISSAPEGDVGTTTKDVEVELTKGTGTDAPGDHRRGSADRWNGNADRPRSGLRIHVADDPDVPRGSGRSSETRRRR